MAATFYSSLVAQILVALVVVGAGVNATDCDFSDSCDSMTLSTASGPRLSASCANCNGDVLTTAVIDLNQRVKNDEGSLVCESTGGSFANSCSSLSLSGSTLSASCRTSSGTSLSTSIDLDNCIGNINGNLVWCVGTGPCVGMGANLALRTNTTLLPSANLTATL